ncbi:MAG: Collagenase and Endostatin [Labilithrix sp.]|nr:Collagenase and Endostatin [Labilithrix sp.]
MRPSIGLGFAAILTLVQGCSSAGSTPTDALDVGQGDPATGSDEGTPAGGTSADPAAPPATNTTPPPGSTPAPAPAPAPSAPPEKSKMTFFVTSTGTAALGGNLGGLAGADKKCQDLATAVKSGDHTWHAYLSITGTSAKDRIGTGPWQNQKGKVIAANVAALHDYQFLPKNADLVDENGALVPTKKNTMLTGSKQDGTPALQTCQGWTSAAGNQQGHVGDAASDSSVLLGVRWNDAVTNNACSQQGLTAGGGEGRLYCFAID